MKQTISPDDLIECVLQCQKGETQAFETLFQQTIPWVENLIRGILLEEQAVKDCVQDTYTLVWEKIRQLRDPKAFLAWLKRLVLHVSLRSAKRIGLHEGSTSPLERAESEGQSTTEGSPEQQVVSKIELLDCLRELPVRDRALLVYRELLGLTYEELADLFAVPVGTIRSRLNQAKKKAKSRLESQGETAQ